MFAPSESVGPAVRVNKPPDDLAARIDTASLSADLSVDVAGHVKRREPTVPASNETVGCAVGLTVLSHDLPPIIDAESERKRRIGNINRNEAVVASKIAMEPMVDVTVESDDVTFGVDCPHVCADRPWHINLIEFLLAENKPVSAPAGIRVEPCDVTGRIDRGGLGERGVWDVDLGELPVLISEESMDRSIGGGKEPDNFPLRIDPFGICEQCAGDINRRRRRA
jgi:hypothetical protein